MKLDFSYKKIYNHISFYSYFFVIREIRNTLKIYNLINFNRKLDYINYT